MFPLFFFINFNQFQYDSFENGFEITKTIQYSMCFCWAHRQLTDQASTTSHWRQGCLITPHKFMDCNHLPTPDFHKTSFSFISIEMSWNINIFTEIEEYKSARLFWLILETNLRIVFEILMPVATPINHHPWYVFPKSIYQSIIECYQ